MSFSHFGEEQLTQPSGDIFEHQGYNALDLYELLHKLGCGISELLPGRAGEPVTIYIGGEAAAVLENSAYQSIDGLLMFMETESESSLISRVVNSLGVDNGLKLQLAATTLQATMDAVPQVKQRLIADAASIEPIYSCAALKVIIPRWELPYAIKIHELAFVEGRNDTALRWASGFLIFYLSTTTMGPSSGHILESSVQEHIQASYPQETRYVPRSVFDEVNRKCKASFDFEPILFEG